MSITHDIQKFRKLMDIVYIRQETQNILEKIGIG